MSRSVDVLIVGGGVIGLACAREMAGDGRSVALLDKGDFGREASWAAAGVLAVPEKPDTPAPMRALCARSLDAFPSFAAALEEETGVALEYETSGLLEVFGERSPAPDVAGLRAAMEPVGYPVETLTPEEALRREPALSPKIQGGVFFAKAARVRTPRLCRALVESAMRRGVTVESGMPVTRLVRDGARVVGVETPSGRRSAGTVVLAAGPWSSALAAEAGLSLPMTPIRGQIVAGQGAPGRIRHIVSSGLDYVIPRRDGLVLVGSTVEDVGYNRETTWSGVHGLLHKAYSLFPEFWEMPVRGAWAGLRPDTPDHLPYLGPHPAAPGLLVATGHYRNGILLAPVTASAVGAWLSGRSPTWDPLPFRPNR